MLYKVIQMIGKSGDEVLDKVTSSKLGKSESDFPVYVSDLFTSPITVGSSTDSLIESGKTVVIHNGTKGKTAKVFRSIEVPELTDSSKALFSAVYGKDPESDSDKVVAYILSAMVEDWATDPVKAAYQDFSAFYHSKVTPQISDAVSKAVEKYHVNDKNWKSLYAKAFVKARHDMAVSSEDKPEGKELIAGDDDLFEEVYDKAYQDWETYYNKRGSYIIDDSEEDWKKAAEEAFGKTQFPKTSLSDYIRAFIDTGSIAKREEIMNSKKNKAICSEEEVKDEEVVDDEETIGVEDEDAEKSDIPSEEFFETKEVSAELENPQEAFEEIKDKAEEALEEIKETAEEAIAAQNPASDLENEEVNEKIEEEEVEDESDIEDEELDDDSEDEESEDEEDSDDEEVESSKKPRVMKRRLRSSEAEDDGWSDEVRDILDTDLKSVLRLDYEIKNGQRGALTGCKDEEQLAEHVYSLGRAFIEDAKALGADIDSGKAPNLRDSMQDVIGKICSYKHDDVGDPSFMEAVDDFLDNVKQYLTLEQFLNEVMAYFPTETWAEFFRSIDSDYELDSAIGHSYGIDSEEEDDYEDTEVEEIYSEDFDVTVEDTDFVNEPVDLGMLSRTPSSLRPKR